MLKITINQLGDSECVYTGGIENIEKVMNDLLYDNNGVDTDKYKIEKYKESFHRSIDGYILKQIFIFNKNTIKIQFINENINCFTEDLYGRYKLLYSSLIEIKNNAKLFMK